MVILFLESLWKHSSFIYEFSDCCQVDIEYWSGKSEKKVEKKRNF